MTVPNFLQGYEKLYEQNPRSATVQWFQEAQYGLFMHYGVYSLLGRGEWVMFHEKIPVREYEKLKKEFTAVAFDADFITDLALEAGMRYITITARHHDSFCLFRTDQTHFNSVDAPCNRDLIEELAIACDKKNLGLFLYYSYGLDWRHPYFFSRGTGNSDISRPAYTEPDPTYLYQQESDFQHYLDFVHAQIRELLTQYGAIAGLWFDPIMPYYQRPEMFPIEETYALVRSLQPQCLIVFKQGANGDEDFASPERKYRSLAYRFEDEDKARFVDSVWQMNRHKHNEICATLQPKQWGYHKADDGNHCSVEDVLEMLSHARSHNCNLLLNTGPLPDGSIDPVDAGILREVGARIRRDGFPNP